MEVDSPLKPSWLVLAEILEGLLPGSCDVGFVAVVFKVQAVCCALGSRIPKVRVGVFEESADSVGQLLDVVHRGPGVGLVNRHADIAAVCHVRVVNLLREMDFRRGD